MTNPGARDLPSDDGTIPGEPDIDAVAALPLAERPAALDRLADELAAALDRLQTR